VKDERQVKFDSIFDKYDAKIEEQKQEMLRQEAEQLAEKKSEHNEMGRFQALVMDIVKPTMDEIAKGILDRGHEAHVEVSEEKDSLKLFSCKLLVFPGVKKPTEDCNRLGWKSFMVCFSPGQKVGVRISSFSSSSSKAVPMEEVTTELIEEEIIADLANVFLKA
jgi:hypothetical protein